MELRIAPVCTRRELRTYIHLPAKIHRNHTNWIPPIYSDEWEFFDSRRNRSFGYSDVILLIAYRGKEAVGRIMGLINRIHNDLHGERNARFNFLESYEDPEISRALVRHVEDWARIRGMEKLVGPLAFSDKDPQGFLIHGFHEPVVIASHCNFEYMVQYLDQMGFQKEIDLVVYKIPIPSVIPALYKKIAERASRNNPGIRLLEFYRRKDLKRWIRPIFSLVNETFTSIYGFMPFSEQEMDDFANRYLMVMDPRFIKIVVNEKNQVVAFVIGMPDISRGIKKCGGYLFPLGFLHILAAGRRSRQLNLLLGAIHPGYQKRGIDSMMGCAMLESAMKRGMHTIDSHLEMESNHMVRAEMEYMGGEVYKTFRIFGKPLKKLSHHQEADRILEIGAMECG